jgi:glycosyltransferase involved in cell wall biosynthesis
MISIIIPTRNEEMYIEKTLRQFQPYKKKYNLQIIVSDGNSTDNTVKIAEKLADDVVLQEGHAKNIAGGRNNGTKVAKGDIFFFMDADVRINQPDVFFQKVYETFQNEKIVAATAPNRVYPEEENFADLLYHKAREYICKLFIVFGSAGASGECEIIRKSTFLRINGFNEKLVAAEDMDLMRRARKLGRVCFIKGLVVYESSRRYRKVGYIKIIWTNILDTLSMLFFGKSSSKEWVPIR